MKRNLELTEKEADLILLSLYAMHAETDHAIQIPGNWGHREYREKAIDQAGELKALKEKFEKLFPELKEQG